MRRKDGKKKARLPVKTEAVAIRTFAEKVPLIEFHEALELSKDTRFEKLWALMLDQAHRHTSFVALCNLAGISLTDLYDFWHKHQLHAGLIEMLNHVPKVLGDVGVDAESRNTACNRCDGQGKVLDIIPGSDVEPEERLCPVCEGSGKMRVVGDKAARDLLFESIGLTGKRPPMVAIQQNFGLESELGDVLLTSQKIITGGSE